MDKAPFSTKIFPRRSREGQEQSIFGPYRRSEDFFHWKLPNMLIVALGMVALYFIAGGTL